MQPEPCTETRLSKQILRKEFSTRLQITLAIEFAPVNVDATSIQVS